MDKSEFFRWLSRESHESNPSQGIVFVDEIVVKPIDCKFKSLTLIGIEFRGGLLFENGCDLGVGVKFINCTGKNLGFSGSKTWGYNRSFDPNNAGIILDTCQFRDLIVGNGCSFERGITIRNESVIGRVVVVHSEFKEGGISVSHSTIETLFDINDIEARDGYGIHLDYCQMKAKPRIEFIRNGTISILKTHFYRDAFVIGCNLSNLTFNESEFDDDFKIQACKIGTFTSYSDSFKRRLVVDIRNNSVENMRGSLKEIHIMDSHTGEGFEFNGFETSVDLIRIPFSNSSFGLFSFSSFNEIHRLELSGQNTQANVTFTSCWFQRILIENLVNKASLIFSSCSSQPVESAFEIVSSSLGNTLFLNVGFTSFERVDIYNSILTKIEFSGGDIFNEEQLFSLSKHSNFSRAKENNSRLPTEFIDSINSKAKQQLQNLNARKKEIYRQLRVAADNQGDRILSTDYKSLELKYYRKELRNSKRWYNKDRIVLGLSTTNDMGLNWSKPLGILILLTLFMYFPIVISASSDLSMANVYPLNEIDFGKSFDTYCQYSYFLPQMLNPARVLERSFDYIDHKFGAFTWDALHRIGLAFLIFQMVSAFRKYIK
ncbi:MAG: hypothetical protein RIF36_17110 [Imperialibacter sp.]|uniref:hypothetical protein n=1 Tax=Imperialibacter sp. TaxID=2038411 RepID=UPI0032EAD7A5